MLTPRTLQRCFKAFFAIAFASLMVVMLGPFQDLELRFGLTDKEAHAIAFFAVTNALFIIAPAAGEPTWPWSPRRWDWPSNSCKA
jgi:hypothetical protein